MYVHLLILLLPIILHHNFFILLNTHYLHHNGSALIAVEVLIYTHKCPKLCYLGACFC